MRTMLILQKKHQIIAENKLVKIFQLCLFTFLIASSGKAQDSCAIKISLLTCSPGNELYSIFGHSALRIQDQNTGTDIVYNYGTFDFNDPEFYSKFVRGKLLYFLSQNNYGDFINSYASEQRSIAEQFIDLSCQKKVQLQQYIWENMQEENRYYKYDFIYDNCTTRLRDIIEKFQDSGMNTHMIPQAADATFRNALYYYLDRGQMQWSKLGIDLLLGSPIDKKMTNREAMFLPEYLETGLDSTKNVKHSLIVTKQYPVSVELRNNNHHVDFTTPLFIFSALFLLILLVSFSRNSYIASGLKIFDDLYFTTFGFLGCLFIFMWFFTDHRQTTHNYNLLWAWPTHIFWFIIKRFIDLRKFYVTLYFIVGSLVLLLWFFLPQQLNVALIPVMGIAVFRIWKNRSEIGKRPSD